LKAVETKDGVLLDVHVKPRSGTFKTVIEGDDVVVYCSEEPQGGRVNRELVKELSRLFHKKVELVSGFTSKDKRLLMRNAAKSEIEQALSGR
jgi:uncharacterized protein (TIGR00251 family)